MTSEEAKSIYNQVYQTGDGPWVDNNDKAYARKTQQAYEQYLADHPDEVATWKSEFDADPSKLSFEEDLGGQHQSGFKSLLNKVGLIDSNAGARATKQAEIEQQKSQDVLNTGMQGVRDMYTNKDSDLWKQVDNQDTEYGVMKQSIGKSKAQNWNELDAGDTENVMGYLNPKMDTINNQVAQSMRGQGGGALQSSGMNRAVANAVADSTGKMWDTAYNQAMTDSANNQGIAKTNASLDMNYGNLQQQQFENNTQPFIDWAQTEEDLTGLNYNGQLGLGQQAVESAGTKQTLFGW